MRPLPDRFGPFVRWAALRCALGPDHTPPIFLATPPRLEWIAPHRFVLGCFQARGEVWIRDDLDDETTREAIAHELAHAFQHTKGWPADEPFARQVQTELMVRWRNGSGRGDRPWSSANAAWLEAREAAQTHRTLVAAGDKRHPREAAWIEDAEAVALRELERVLGAEGAA